MTKESLNVDMWLKEIAPSDDLRKWYSHDPEKWYEFRKRYFSELDSNSAISDLIELCRSKDAVFLYSAKNREINNAVALKEYVLAHL